MAFTAIAPPGSTTTEANETGRSPSRTTKLPSSLTSGYVQSLRS
jgi:hypothetical protein